MSASTELGAADTDRVLVAHIPSQRDLLIAHERHWYRIRSRSVADRIQGGIGSFSHIAFYQPACFGTEKYCVQRFAEITNIKSARRLDLLPDEPAHPRALEEYLKLELGPVQLLPSPIVSQRGRRLLFVPTTWARLLLAREVNDLFAGSRVEELLYARLRERGLCPERQYSIEYRDPSRSRSPRKSYFLDFALFCARKSLNIETDGDHRAIDSAAATRDAERDRVLEAHGWQVLRFGSAEIERELDPSLARIAEAVERFGGIKPPNRIPSLTRNTRTPAGSAATSV